MRIIVCNKKTSPFRLCAFTEKQYLCIMIREIMPEHMASLLCKRPHNAHKGTMGHAVLMAGSTGIAGCAVLSAESCLRSGAGKLTVLTPEANRIILQISVPEAITQTPDKASATLRNNSIQAIGIGPGIGTDNLAATQTAEMLSLAQDHSIPIVLDADALHLLATHPQWISHIENRAILTPHPGEMKHLMEGFGLTDDMQYCAQTMAQKYKITVILKGHPTFIYLSNGETFFCLKGNPGMATAGSGDVLTGLITGLLAQGYPNTHAAQLGVWLHATAGDHASKEWEEECMLARDITQHLPQAFAALK